MEHQLIKKSGYNLHVMPNDKFTTNKISVKFIIPAKKEQVTSLKVLANYVYEANTKYPSFKDLVLKSEDNYIINFDNDFSTLTNNFAFTNTINFLEEKYTSRDVLKNSIDFLMNTIYNVSFNNQETLSVILNKVEKDILRIKDNRKRYASLRFMETFIPDEPISYRMNGYLEDLVKINLNSLKEYYEYLINNAQIDVFFVGNIDNNLLEETLDSWFGNRINNEYSFKVNEQNLRENILEEKEQIDANQSNLFLGFKISDMSEFEKFAVLPVFSYVYGGSGSSILFDTVREKNSLCYTVHSNTNRIYKYMAVYAGISAENYDKAKDLILLELNNMENEKYAEELIENAKKTIISDSLSIEDSKNSIIDYISSLTYLDVIPIEERLELIKKVNKKDISNLIKKISLDTIYFLEGVSNEKTNI